MVMVPADTIITEIAQCLRQDGFYETRVDAGDVAATGHLQAAVDVGWKVRQAGRLLGRRVRVRTRRGEIPGQLVVRAELVAGVALPPPA